MVGSASHHEIAIPIGSGLILPSDRPPYRCDIDERIAVHHDPIAGEIADCTRALYYTRRLSEDLAHNGAAPKPVRIWAEDVARYSNDLEFFARQLALSLKMPVMVDEPYLPVDIQAMPMPLLLLRPPPTPGTSHLKDDATGAQRPRLHPDRGLRQGLSDFL